MITDGYWMLFADNNNGTPSVAATIKIGQVGIDVSVPNIGTTLMLNGTACPQLRHASQHLHVDHRQWRPDRLRDER